MWNNLYFTELNFCRLRYVVCWGLWWKKSPVDKALYHDITPNLMQHWSNMVMYSFSSIAQINRGNNKKCWGILFSIQYLAVLQLPNKYNQLNWYLRISLAIFLGSPMSTRWNHFRYMWISVATDKIIRMVPEHCGQHCCRHQAPSPTWTPSFLWDLTGYRNYETVPAVRGHTPTHPTPATEGVVACAPDCSAVIPTP